MKFIRLLLLLPIIVICDELNIAVLDLDAIGIEQQSSQILTNKLRSDLVNTGKVTIVDRGEMNTILTEQEFQQTGCTSQECAIEVGQLLGVSHIVSGSISLMSDLYYINAKLINVESGVIEKSIDEYVKADITEVLMNGMPMVANKLVSNSIIEEQVFSTTVESQPLVPVDNEELNSRRKGKIIGAVISSICMTTGFTVGLIKNSEVNTLYEEYSAIEGYDKQGDLDTKRDEIESAKTIRNVFYGIGGAGAVGLTISIAIPSSK